LHIFCNFSKPADYFGEVIEDLFTKKSANNLYFIWLITKSWKGILSQKYYPVLKITREYNSPLEWIQVSTHNLNKLANYDIPITYTTQTHRHFTSTLNNILLRHFLKFGLRLKENGWILFNIQQTGKYVTNLSHFML